MARATKLHGAAVAPYVLLAALAAFGAGVSAKGDKDPMADHREAVKDSRLRQSEILDRQEEIYALKDSEKRELSAEEVKEYGDLQNEYDALENDVTRRTGLIARHDNLHKPAQRQTEPGQPGAFEAGRTSEPMSARSPRHGFKNSGEFYKAVRNHYVNAITDPLLRNAAASTIATEGVGEDGGFAVPPEFRATLMERVFGESSLLGMTDPIPLSGNQITMPSDMTTPWGSSGLQAYWDGEAQPRTQSKPKFEGVTTKLNGISCFVLASGELLDDAPALGGYIERKAPEVIDFKVSYALTWGNGAGMPLGFMNAPCFVSQAAEGAQTADTINATNVLKMFSRMPINLRNRAAWLIHPDAEHQLPLMTIGNMPMYIAPGSGMRDDPYGRLLGRPVIPHEVCETVGDLGDIMLVDMMSYLSVKKAAGLKSDTSIHAYFDQNLTAFRFLLRIGGQPWWSAPISPRDGSMTRSPFIGLAAR